MSLYSETAGQGPPLVFIHGWGMHGGFWASTTEQLNQDYTTNQIDLPGHGHSPLTCGSYGLPTLVNEVGKLIKENTTLIGWSLGGMIAIEIARQFPASIARLILVASTPQFHTSPNWPHAMKADTLAIFAQQLKYHADKTLQRFLALQAHGCHNARQTIRTMQALLSTREMPRPQALEGGLTILRNVDLHTSLVQIKCPTLIIHGDRDVIIPVQATQAFDQHIADVQTAIIPSAGHAPFLTHPEAFIRATRDFCSET